MEWLIAIIALPTVLLIGLATQKRWQRWRYYAPRLLATYISLVMLLVMGELYFRYVYAESGWGFTLAYKNWEERYWETNSLGFRDREWQPEDWIDKKTIMVIGDSFSAGWGIENPNDRYPNVLATLLGDNYVVVNAARPGGTTRNEMEWVLEHPLENPDIVIFQYYLNDIDDAALSINDYWAPQFPEPPQWIDEGSYLANFLYWRIVPLWTTVNAADGRSYWDWNQAAFGNFAIFDIHREELQQVVDFAQEADARLIVVIFPNMQDPAGSIRRVDAIAHFFEDAGYTDILKLFDEAAAWEPDEAIVSSRDAHPSVAFHQRVAELIHQNFFVGEAAQ